MLLNNQWIKVEIKRENKYLNTNKSGNVTYQNLWDAEKAVLREKFIAINPYFKEQKKSQVNNLILYLETTKAKGSWRGKNDKD